MANILIVEDNDEVAEVFKAILEEAGHQVESSSAAYSAILKASKIKFDIILMDLLLQGSDGAVAALALRGLGVDAPIIVITGNMMPLDQEIYDRVGFAGKLLKPIRPQELVDEIDRQLAEAERE